MEYFQTICTSFEFLKNTWAFIRECYNYHELLDEKCQTLRKRKEKLRCQEKDVHDQLRNSQYDSGKKRKREVESWLQNTRQKITEVQQIEADVGSRRYLSRSHFLRIVDKNIQEVNELIEEGVFPEGILIDVHQRGEALLTTPLVGQTTAGRNFEKIWKFLMDDEMPCIGVYGMGGVGKTTVMTHIHNRLLENHSFTDHVYWVTVSQESSIHKLQNEIAKCIHIDLLKENDERKRATRLYQALRSIKKFVVILDDMWDVFLPEDIGIPVGVEEGRLLITTRSLEVCRRMQCQQSIMVESLSEEEAWDLFMKNVWSDEVVDKEVKEIAKSIAMECDGLPLAIVTTARSMRGVDDIHDWRNALVELREQVEGLVDIEKVFKQLKFSYDRLKNEKLKRCFLYCASFPEDYTISRVELIVYWIAEGLLGERGTRNAQYDMGHSILNQLENVCLLEGVEAEVAATRICVKMHDVIRDMALNITKENGSAIFEVKSGKRSLHITNEKEWSENLERVFLEDDIIEEYLSPSISPKCPRLLTLQLHLNYSIIELPNSFFVHMQSLRILNLSNIENLERLPNSISDLISLRGLFLKYCSRLEYVPSLAELKELRELHLHFSGVKAVPTGLKELINLKCLDLSYVSGIQSIPTGLLPSLSNLQCLRLDSCNIDVQTEELITLRQIEMLGVNFSNLDEFNSYVYTEDWERLSHYHLQIHNPDEEYVLTYLKCREVSIYCIDHVILLPTNMQVLNIHDCVLPTSLLDFSPSLRENACKDLVKCLILCCEGIEDLWSFTTTTTSAPQNLQFLLVYSLPDLKRLFKYEGVEMGGRPPAESGTFSHLKLLNVYKCGKLKYLLTARLVRHHMQNLESIHVRDCSQMEHIIIEEEEEGITTERNSILTFSKLQTLYLVDVPELKSISIGTKTMVCPSLEEIEVFNCPKLKRLSLSTMNVDDSRRTSESQLDSPIKIRGRKEWWDLLEWDNPEAKSVLQISIFEEQEFPTHIPDHLLDEELFRDV